MSIDTLAALLDLHAIMWIVVTLFVINMTITGIETVLDLTTQKERAGMIAPQIAPSLSPIR